MKKRQTTTIKKLLKILVIMKLSFFFILLSISAINASVYSQTAKFSISSENITIREAFKEIEKQSFFSFLYNDDYLDLNKRISLNVKEKKLNEILDIIFANTDLSYKILDNNLVVLAPKKNLFVRVTGNVISSSDSMPIPGVTVLEKGTTNGTITNVDGNYFIDLEGTDPILVFSSIGFQTIEIPVAGRSTVDVVMQEKTENVEEVIVVGYGVQKKSNITGAISQVKAEDMENRTITNPLQALAGKTAGAQVYSSSASPGSSPIIRIRGVNSNNAIDPLYVVDGRVASSIAGIEPNDIESMEILKDAASAAVYGAQAGNGVILITTKKGKIGKGIITYDYQLIMQSLGKIPKVMNSEQFIDYYTEAGKFSLDRVYKYWDFKQNTDWINEIFETSIMQRHNVSFQGGNERGTYYVSGSMLDNNGMVVGDADTYKRYTGMINSNYNIKPWLEIGTNNQIEYWKRRSVSEGSEYSSLILSTLQLDPMTAVTYTEANMPDNMTTALANYRATGLGELLNDGNGNYYGVSPFLTSENLNPLIMRDRAYSLNSGFNLNGTSFLNLKPIKGLVITSRFSYLLSTNESYGYSNDYYANSKAYQYFMSVNASTSENTRIQWENFATYAHSFNKHNITAMLGTTFTKIRNYGVSGSRTGVYNDSTQVFGVERDDPRFYYMDYAVDEATREVSGGTPSLQTQNAYLGRISYNYNEKYLAEIVFRADAFDAAYLPEKNRWGYFPGISLGWIVSREAFMEPTSNVIDHLKLRLSWGQNGSLAGLGSYAYLTSVSSTGSYPFTSDPVYNIGYKPSTTGNEELKWETHEQIDIGLDARFLNNRLSMTFDYFNKKTKDLIVTGTTPSTIMGNTASPINAGNIENKGLEFELGWQDKIGSFIYGIRGNVSSIKNKVTNIHKSLDYIAGASFHTTTGITRFEVGKPAWHFYGYQFQGIDAATGDPVFVDQNTDGTINDDDKVELGKGIPDLTYGITINAAFKGFDIIIFGQGSYGNDIYSCLNRTDYAVNSLTYFTENRWKADNTAGTNPRAGANDLDKYYTSSAVIFNGSYFKIKQIQLGYTLPSIILEKFKISKFRIYASLEDYFTFTEYIGFDPEITGYRNSMGVFEGNSIGIDKGSYPTPKKVIFGVNISF